MLSDHYLFEFSETFYFTFYFMSEVCFNVYNLIQPQVLFWWLWEEKLLTSLSPSPSARAYKRVHAPFELVCILFLKPSVLPLSGSFLSACWSSRSLLITSFHKRKFHCWKFPPYPLSASRGIHSKCGNKFWNIWGTKQRYSFFWAFSSIWEMLAIPLSQISSFREQDEEAEDWIRQVHWQKMLRAGALRCFLSLGPSESVFIWPFFFFLNICLEEWFSKRAPGIWSLSSLQQRLCVKPTGGRGISKTKRFCFSVSSSDHGKDYHRVGSPWAEAAAEELNSTMAFLAVLGQSRS